MSWFIVDDDAHTHPKFIAAGNAAIGLWTRCGAYSAKYGLGGHIPTDIARAYGRPADIRRLIEVGLWDEVEGGYQFHDWADRNDTIEQARAKRERSAEKQRRYRQRQAGVTGNATGNNTGNETGDATGDLASARNRPEPTRPEPSLTDVLKSPPPPRDSCGETDGGGGRPDGYIEAIERAVDAEQAAERNPITNTLAWRNTVRKRIETDHGPAIAAALQAGQTPTQAAALVRPTSGLADILRGAWT